MTLAEIAAAMRGDLAPGHSDSGPAEGAAPLGERMVSGYSIDSRTLQAGDLFFAIAGPRVDGHEFIGAAVRQGASAVVVAPARATWPAVWRTRSRRPRARRSGRDQCL